jgi:CRISPR-associated protein (TIGR03986 family)
MKLERGTLVVTQAGKNKPPRIQVRIGDKPFNVAQGEVSQSVLDRLQELNGKEVEFERVGGQPKKIREAGGEFIPPGAKAQARGSPQPPKGAAPARPSPGPAGGGDRPRHRFHNPYNFVPAPPRNVQDPDLGDGEPVRQDRYEPERYTGCIRVRMKVVTPLLLIDPENASNNQNDHLTFPIRKDADGQPLIAASSVRGMLRSAYETITNSRFCRFSDEYKSRLAYRMEAREGLRMIPARISGGMIHLFTGTSKVNNDGTPDGPMHAAWLPRYRNGQISGKAPRYSKDELPEHGDEVVCKIEHVRHGSGRFEYWRVVEIRRVTEAADLAKHTAQQGDKGQPKIVRGWVCITNANINGKHDERVFFQDEEGEKLGPFPLTDELKQQWRELIENYQRLHKDEIAQRRRQRGEPDQYLGHEPGRTAWSRHVYDPQYLELRDGTLCYARLGRGKKQVEALFPVMISRELYECSPWDLLPESLRPAGKIKELSPADRVFGWVHSEPSSNKAERVAARGLVRVGPVRCETEDAIEEFCPPLPLAILSTPKPQQGRFYVAKSPQGEAQQDGLNKTEAGYRRGKGLRGRKVYPHHNGLLPGHWTNPLEDRTQEGPPNQEYRRPQINGQEQQDNQNRSVCGWVKPGSAFTFDLYVENLSLVELGALLWLLKLPEGHFLRLGGGRPLGFGSVRLDLESCDLRTPEGLKVWYSRWHGDDAASDPRERAIEALKKAVLRAYGGNKRSFEEVPFIAAFLRACRGFDDRLPIHYPRVTPAPDPEGENYRWFVENERQGRYALPDLVKDKGLPLLEARSSSRP